LTAAPVETPASLFRWALLVLIAGAIVFALTRWLHPPAHREAPIETLRLSYGPRDYAAALKLADNAVALGTDRVQARPQDWINQESFARAMLGRARLTVSFDDLQAAMQALAKAKTQVGPRDGPLLTDAVANFTVHRLAPIIPDLDELAKFAVPAEPADRAEAAALRGDVDFYSGRYDAALDHYRAASGIIDGPGAEFRLALYALKTGDPDAARAHFERSARINGGRTRQFMGNVWLQIGVVELSRGKWAEAEAAFTKADQVFPGYWLIEAHRAQMAALRGQTAEAARAYEAILKQGEQPDVIDALAILYRSMGNRAASVSWAAKSKAIWTKRLGQLPEAAYAHALEHELVLGDPAKALDLARKNMAVRPYGDSSTMLAWTLMANNRAAEAVQILTALNKTKWRTAQQYIALSQAQAMLGHSAESDAARDEALKLNPRASDPASSLIWFGNH
jgi:tetratricopeptide (TPR) repeat protein